MPDNALITRLKFGKSPALYLGNPSLNPNSPEAIKKSDLQLHINCHSAQNKQCHPGLDPGSSDKFEHHTSITPALCPPPSAILLHGYGGRKEDMLAIALALQAEGISCLIPDLPGHGESPDTLNIDNISALIGDINLLNSNDKLLIIGHSIGSNIAFNTSVSHIIALSPPGEVFFEGGNKELLKILRARRVREASPYQGLQEILSEFPTNRVTDDCVLLYAKNELRSVTDNVKKLQKENGVNTYRISDANHLDIITSNETIQKVTEYAKQRLL